MQTIEFLVWPMSNICRIDSGFRFWVQNNQIQSLGPPPNALKKEQKKRLCVTCSLFFLLFLHYSLPCAERILHALGENTIGLYAPLQNAIVLSAL